MDLRSLTPDTDTDTDTDVGSAAPPSHDGSASPADAGIARLDAAAGDGLALLDEHALRQLLATQPVIEQAKGLLMGCYRLDADQAFAVLRRWSSHQHIKVRGLASQLLDAAAQPGPTPFQPTEVLTLDQPGRTHTC